MNKNVALVNFGKCNFDGSALASDHTKVYLPVTSPQCNRHDEVLPLWTHVNGMTSSFSLFLRLPCQLHFEGNVTSFLTWCSLFFQACMLNNNDSAHISRPVFNFGTLKFGEQLSFRWIVLFPIFHTIWYCVPYLFMLRCSPICSFLSSYMISTQLRFHSSEKIRVYLYSHYITTCKSSCICVLIHETLVAVFHIHCEIHTCAPLINGKMAFAKV